MTAWLPFVDSMHSVYQDDYGVLRCADCGDVRVCEGIEKAIVDHLDAETLWTQLDAILKLGEKAPVVVPFITKYSLHLAMKAKDVGIQDIVEMTFDPPQASPISFWLRRGEGRRVAKSMFYQEFLAKIGINPVLHCSRSAHSYAANATLRSHIEGNDEVDRIAELFSIWQSGACLTCLSLVSGNFLQQFVPEDPRKK